jgi:hypothetical protein
MRRFTHLLIGVPDGGRGGCASGYKVTTTHELVPVEGRLSSGRVGGVECDWLTDSAGKRYWCSGPAAGRSSGIRYAYSTPKGRTVAQERDLLMVRGPSDGIGESLCAPNVFRATDVARLDQVTSTVAY